MSEYDDLIEEPAPKGPKRRPGPNDEAIAGKPTPTLGEEIAEELEEAQSLPPLVRASDLLPKQEDPLEAIPVEPPDDDTPPDDALPTFLVRRNRYGPGAHSVLLANGEPVGVWLDREHHELDGDQVAELLEGMGLEEDLVPMFKRFRDRRIASEKELAANPAVQRTASEETRRKAEKEIVQKAFLEAHKRKK